MARGAKRIAVAAATVLALLAACRGGNDKLLPTATVPTAPETTTTTLPYAVPPVIDAAYVNRVIDGLDAITGDANRLVVETRTTPREVFDRMRAIYARDEDVDLRLKDFANAVSRGLPYVKPNPGNRKSVVREILSSSPNCIYVRVNRDYSSLAFGAATDTTEWIAIRPLDRARDPYGLNPTGWAYVFEGFISDRGRPERDPCLA
ncbi:MAG: hypothetical protein ACRD12_06735 [Acidimicrobiales bacterium]